mmetsp:Transcript_24836/g.50457  ORF Transcript_24836/g.50457 Transcript_24836/m.50457 type:complete len:121 (-) Transcript_24836:18-380(-)
MVKATRVITVLIKTFVGMDRRGKAGWWQPIANLSLRLRRIEAARAQERAVFGKCLLHLLLNACHGGDAAWKAKLYSRAQERKIIEGLNVREGAPHSQDKGMARSWREAKEAKSKSNLAEG